MRRGLSKQIITQINEAVQSYTPRMQDYDNLAKRVKTDFTENEDFNKLIHSSKFRPKAPEHLRNKLIRLALEAAEKNKKFTITKKNFFRRINDLAGVRFLHLHTEQMKIIHPKILDILAFYGYNLKLRPVAYIWDIENKKLFDDIGLRTVFRPSMYASIHYVVTPPWGSLRCEIQVRTLMDEVWGEVSHIIDYPTETESIECREQLRALARIASGATRLVDSIFMSYKEHEKRLEKKEETKQVTKIS